MMRILTQRGHLRGLKNARTGLSPKESKSMSEKGSLVAGPGLLRLRNGRLRALVADSVLIRLN